MRVETQPVPEVVGEKLDKPREECGVFGAVSHDLGVTGLAYDALRALQHRGQDAAGIAVGEGYNQITVIKNEGLVSEAFANGTYLGGYLDARVAIGHVRYSTTDATDGFAAAHPLVEGPFALAQNGHIQESEELADRYGVNKEGKTDTQVLVKAMGNVILEGANLEESLQEILPNVKGSFSLAITDGERLIAARDRHGNRPFAFGRLPDGGWTVASETTALDMIGAETVGHIEPGTYAAFDSREMSTHQWAEAVPGICTMEYVYFASPDSMIDGIRVASSRIRSGRELAKEHPVEADVVAPVPDSGRSAAAGFSKQAGIELVEEAIVKRRNSKRSFIEPSQAKRQRTVQEKLNVIPEFIEGKRVVVVDDSIIRGNTMRHLVAMLRSKGALEVHLRVSSPENKYTCDYGIATADPDELIAANMDNKQMEEDLGVDSLGFLSIEGMQKAIGAELCMKCMTGNRPGMETETSQVELATT